MPNFFYSSFPSFECMYLMWFCICFFSITVRFFALLLYSFTIASKVFSVSKRWQVSSTYLSVSGPWVPFSLSVETLKVFSRQEVKSLSEIPPINSTLQTDLYPVFELNMTVSFVKICLGHLPCGSCTSFAGLQQNISSIKSNFFWVPKPCSDWFALLFSLLCSWKEI